MPGAMVARRLCGALVMLCLLTLATAAATQAPPLIRLGHGGDAEEQLWLMMARPNLAPNQNTKYRLRFMQFPGLTERFRAYEAGDLDAGTSPAPNALVARAQGARIKIVASIALEAAGQQWFSTTFMVKDDGPVRTPADLRAGSVAVAEQQSPSELGARVGLMKAGLVPDRDVRIVSMRVPAIGPAVRSDRVTTGAFLEPFYSSEVARGGLRPLFTAVEAVGYDHELLDLWFSEKFLRAHHEAVRAFLADYVAATKHYLAHRDEARRDLVSAGFVRTPLALYRRSGDWKRDPDGHVDVESLRKLSVLMLDKLGWLERPVSVEDLVDQSYLPR